MKKFKEFLIIENDDEMYDGVLNESIEIEPGTLERLEKDLAVLSANMVNHPYVGFTRMMKLLSYYNDKFTVDLAVEKSDFEYESNEMVFPLFYTLEGGNQNGEFKSWDDSLVDIGLAIYFGYSVNSRGMYDVTMTIVDEDEIDDLDYMEHPAFDGEPELNSN